MSAVVVIPLAVTDEYREAAYAFVSRRLIEDGWPIVAYEGDQERWCKACTVRGALDAADEHVGMHPDDVLIIHDADVVLDLWALRAAVGWVERGDVAWAIPHQAVYRLSEAASAAYMRDAHLSSTPDLVRWPYIGVPGGGCVVLRRSTYDDCPLDRRFLGWGDEDQSWGWALGTLHGAPWRAEADLVHLWHPPQPGSQGTRSASLDSNRLRRAYRAYRADPARMRALVADAR